MVPQVCFFYFSGSGPRTVEKTLGTFPLARMPLLLKEDQPPQGVQTAPAPVPTQSPEYKEWLHSCPDYMHHTPSKEGASSAVGRLCGSELPPGLQVDRGAALSKRESPRSVGLHAIQAAAASALAHLSTEAADTPQVLQVAKVRVQ